ncbi:hypothetical protein O6H91_Y127000 [Diphasiastrum complanatum]|nr:hypothetical protein O6H91_Y127000 [Diphasiastrum complanatum]
MDSSALFAGVRLDKKRFAADIKRFKRKKDPSFDNAAYDSTIEMKQEIHSLFNPEESIEGAKKRVKKNRDENVNVFTASMVPTGVLKPEVQEQERVGAKKIEVSTTSAIILISSCDSAMLYTVTCRYYTSLPWSFNLVGQDLAKWNGHVISLIWGEFSSEIWRVEPFLSGQL